MNAADAVVIAIIVILLVAVILKMTVFKGPKWKRDMERAGGRASNKGQG